MELTYRICDVSSIDFGLPKLPDVSSWESDLVRIRMEGLGKQRINSININVYQSNTLPFWLPEYCNE